MARSDYIIKDYLDAMKSNWGDWIGGYNNGALAQCLLGAMEADGAGVCFGGGINRIDRLHER